MYNILLNKYENMNLSLSDFISILEKDNYIQIKDISIINDNEYSKIIQDIKPEDLKLRYKTFKTIWDFENYEQKQLKLIKYQIENKKPDDQILKSLANYFFTKAYLYFSQLKDTQHDDNDKLIVKIDKLKKKWINTYFSISIFSFLFSLEILDKNTKWIMTYCLSNYVQFCCFRENIDVDDFWIEYVSNKLEEGFSLINANFYKKTLEKQLGNEKLLSIFCINYLESYFVFKNLNKKEKIQLYMDVERKFSPILSMNILKETFLDQDKYDIIWYNFKDKHDVEIIFNNDLKLLEKYKDTVVKDDYFYFNLIRFKQKKNEYLQNFEDSPLKKAEIILNTIGFFKCNIKFIHIPELLLIINSSLEFHIVFWSMYKIIELTESADLYDLSNVFSFITKRFPLKLTNDLKQYIDNFKTIEWLESIINKTTANWWYYDLKIQKILFIELCRLFLYKRIGKQQLDWLYAVKPMAFINKWLCDLYNLTLWSHLLKQNWIWIEKENDDFLQICNLKFKEIVLKKNQDELWEYKKDYDSLVWKDQIKKGENVNQEFKWSLSIELIPLFNENKKIWSSDLEIKWSTRLQVIVAMLNTLWWNLVIWVWENLCYNKSITNHNIISKDVIFSKELWDFCITWIENDLNFLNLNLDWYINKIEQVINNKIYPNPYNVWDIIKIESIKLYNKTLLILNIPKGKKPYYYNNQLEDKLGKKHNIKEFYIKTNHWKKLLKDIDAELYISNNFS